MTHILYYLGISIFIIGLAFLFTKYVGSKVTSVQSGKMIKIVETLKIENTKILLIECCGRYYLIGENSSGIELLDQFDEIGQVVFDDNKEFDKIYKSAINDDSQNITNKLFKVKQRYVELKKQIDRRQDYEQKK